MIILNMPSMFHWSRSWCVKIKHVFHTQNAIIGIINTGNPVCLENASSSRFGAWWIKFEQNVTFLPEWDNTQTPGTNLAGTIYPGRGTRTASWHRKPRSRRSSGPFGPRSYPDSAERNPCPGWIIWKWEAKQANIKKTRKQPWNFNWITYRNRVGEFNLEALCLEHTLGWILERVIKIKAVLNPGKTSSLVMLFTFWKKSNFLFVFFFCWH